MTSKLMDKIHPVSCTKGTSFNEMGKLDWHSKENHVSRFDTQREMVTERCVCFLSFLVYPKLVIKNTKSEFHHGSALPPKYYTVIGRLIFFCSQWKEIGKPSHNFIYFSHDAVQWKRSLGTGMLLMIISTKISSFLSCRHRVLADTRGKARKSY